MNEFADINNQFYTLLNRIDKIPNLKDKLTKELLNEKKTHIKVDGEIINLKDSNYMVIEVVWFVCFSLAKIKSNKTVLSK